jgi:hypothetical protein
MLKLKDLLEKAPQLASLSELPILVGDAPFPEVVVAYITLEKQTNYRMNHIRFTESLEELVSELKYFYDMSDEDVLNSVVPIAGFTTIDLVQFLEE